MEGLNVGKSELLEMRDELGFMSCAPECENIRQIVRCVMECLNEIDSLRAHVDNLGEIIHRMEQE